MIRDILNSPLYALRAIQILFICGEFAPLGGLGHSRQPKELNIEEFSTNQNVKHWIYAWYISPPFEGGVAGPLFKLEYKFWFRPGWLIACSNFESFLLKVFII